MGEETDYKGQLRITTFLNLALAHVKDGEHTDIVDYLIDAGAVDFRND